jgi:hypothetical protein
MRCSLASVGREDRQGKAGAATALERGDGGCTETGQREWNRRRKREMEEREKLGGADRVRNDDGDSERPCLGNDGQVTGESRYRGAQSCQELVQGAFTE